MPTQEENNINQNQGPLTHILRSGTEHTYLPLSVEDILSLLLDEQVSRRDAIS